VRFRCISGCTDSFVRLLPVHVNITPVRSALIGKAYTTIHELSLTTGLHLPITICVFMSFSIRSHRGRESTPPRPVMMPLSLQRTFFHLAFGSLRCRGADPVFWSASLPVTFELSGECGSRVSGFVVREWAFQVETVLRVDCRSGRHGKNTLG
jgi:hypothetical protein